MRSLTAHRQHPRALWVAICSLAASSAVLSASTSRPFVHPDQPLREYRALRHMHAYCEDQKHEAWLDAWTELKDGQFSYQVVEERGSEAIRGRVLKAVLEREQEFVNRGDPGRADLTADNYEFTEAGRDESGARVVQLKPRRQDVMLVDGKAVLSDSGDLLRVEGRLSKNPSFWTSLVNIVRRYARVSGVRVPVASETTAHVKFVGVAQLDVVYDYQTVNGRAVALSERRSEELVRTAAQ